MKTLRVSNAGDTVHNLVDCILMFIFVAIADSSNLEIFLELLNDKDIVIAVTFDEASKR